MNKRAKRTTKIIATLLAFVIIMSGISLSSVTVWAAGWLDHVQDITLGDTITGAIQSGDYYGKPEELHYKVYWNVYRFTMPKSGLLNVYVESAAGGYEGYFGNDGNYQSKYTYAIFPGANPDSALWCSGISDNYSSARNMYYGSIEVPLNAGQYYFAIREPILIDDPYYLTLSYKEPIINIVSISLGVKSIKLEPGEQYTFNTTVLPNNATDKTVIWKSSNSSVVSVVDGVVTANSPGNAAITATSPDGEISATCTVTVIDTKTINKLEQARPKITKATSNRKKATIYFSGIDISGIRYQVSYRTGNGKWTTKNVSGTSAEIRNLKSRKTYSIRVRGYKAIDGATYYSQWSATKKLKVK